MRRIIFDTGFNKDTIEKILDRFARDNKVIYKNEWIAIKNFIKHQKDNPKIQRGIEIILQNSPPDLVKWIQDDSKIEYRSLSHTNTNVNNNVNTKVRDNRIKPLIHYFSAAYQNKTGQKPTISGAWGKIFQSLLRNHSDDVVRKVIDTFFSYDKRTKFSIFAFQKTFDNILPRATNTRAFEDKPRTYGTCPDCGAAIMNSGGICTKCGYGR